MDVILQVFTALCALTAALCGVWQVLRGRRGGVSHQETPPAEPEEGQAEDLTERVMRLMAYSVERKEREDG